MTTPVTIEDIYKLFQKSQEESDRRFAEIDRRAAEADRRAAERDRLAAEAKAEADRRAAERDRLAAEAKAERDRLAAEAKAERDRLAAEAKAERDRLAAKAKIEEDRRVAETKIEEDRRAAEAALRKRELDIQLKELGKQIGGLGAKFGSFTEGLALPSMEKILGDRFGMEVISPSVRVSKAGQHLEIDVLAYANSEINKAYVVEVKSHPREESITQLKSILEKFRKFFPEHKDKQVYGILAAVDLSANIRDKILQEGLYVARISDQTFEMDVPDNFRPKAW
jgi:flagellar biosynthesis GTPase FlhF